MSPRLVTQVPEDMVRRGELKNVLTNVTAAEIASKQQALRRVRDSLAYLSTHGTHEGDATQNIWAELRARVRNPEILLRRSSSAHFWT